MNHNLQHSQDQLPAQLLQAMRSKVALRDRSTASEAHGKFFLLVVL
jgi:hypothetical protein